MLKTGNYFYYIDLGKILLFQAISDMKYLPGTDIMLSVDARIAGDSSDKSIWTFSPNEIYLTKEEAKLVLATFYAN